MANGWWGAASRERKKGIEDGGENVRTMGQESNLRYVCWRGARSLKQIAITGVRLIASWLLKTLDVGKYNVFSASYNHFFSVQHKQTLLKTERLAALCFSKGATKNKTKRVYFFIACIYVVICLIFLIFIYVSVGV